jgi:hypothetical protein
MRGYDNLQSYASKSGYPVTLAAHLSVNHLGCKPAGHVLRVVNLSVRIRSAEGPASTIDVRKSKACLREIKDNHDPHHRDHILSCSCALQL